MSSHPRKIPPINTGTLRAAREVLGDGNPYLAIGDRLEAIVDEAKPDHLECSLLGVITLLQFMESLTDRQAANATRNRIEWKYALHLPLISSGMREETLCAYRRSVLHHSAKRACFQRLIDYFLREKFTHDLPVEADVDYVLRPVCRRNRLNWLHSALCQSLESLASTDPDWLRVHGEPTWITRYSPGRWSLDQAARVDGWASAMASIGQDACWLVERIRANPPKSVRAMDLESIKVVLEQQFSPDICVATAADRFSPAHYCTFCRTL